MRLVLDPVEERGGEPREMSGGADAAPATITTTRDALSATLQDFEHTVLPHLDAAYNLARWMTRNGQDAEDVVQEAFVRALRFFGGFRGGNARAWLLAIVRNTCYDWLRRHRPSEVAASFDEEIHGTGDQGPSPEELL